MVEGNFGDTFKMASGVKEDPGYIKSNLKYGVDSSKPTADQIQAAIDEVTGPITDEQKAAFQAGELVKATGPSVLEMKTKMMDANKEKFEAAFSDAQGTNTGKANGEKTEAKNPNPFRALMDRVRRRKQTPST